MRLRQLEVGSAQQALEKYGLVVPDWDALLDLGSLAALSKLTSMLQISPGVWYFVNEV